MRVLKTRWESLGTRVPACRSEVDCAAERLEHPHVERAQNQLDRRARAPNGCSGPAQAAGWPTGSSPFLRVASERDFPV